MRVSTVLLMLFGIFVLMGNAIADTHKVTICHKGQTLSISKSALKAHLDHGDFKYACKYRPRAVALFRCGGENIQILSVSLTAGVPKFFDGTSIAVGSSCSRSINLLLNNGYSRILSNSEYDSKLLGIVTDYGYTGPQLRQ